MLRERQLLPVLDAADLLRVKRHVVYSLIRQGRLHSFKVGREWRLDRAEVERLVNSDHRTKLR